MKTKSLHLHFQFPDSYKVPGNDYVMFVGTHHSRIDHLLEDERQRVSYCEARSGGNVLIDMHTQNPVPYCLYGLA